MPTSTVNEKDEFFQVDDLDKLARDLKIDAPIIKGRVWGGDERHQGWSVECDSFAEFEQAVSRLRDTIELLAFDEMVVDEDTLRFIQDDLFRAADEDGISTDTVSKGVSALRSHENEVYAVVAYAFLASGRVIFVRAQTELARFVHHPERLLSNDGLASVRKLKTLVDC